MFVGGILTIFLSHTLEVIYLCVCVCVYYFRNSQSFEDTVRTMPDLKLLFFRTLLDWLSALRSHSLFSVVDLLDLSDFCN